jgi:N-methylhydantoinase A
VGAQLGLSAVEVASAMVRVTNENMANAIRIVTVEQGIDPRDFALVAMGGAGPTHAAEIADSMGIRRVLVPVNPGLCSAFGALAAQVRVDAVKSVHLTDTRATADGVSRLFADLERQALADFEAQAGGSARHEIRRSAALRYQGQNYEQEVALPGGELTPAALTSVYEDFARLYEGFYGYRLDGIPIELVRLQAVAAGDEQLLPAPSQVAATPGEDASRDVWFPQQGLVPTPIVRREAIAARTTRRGPLIVEEMDSTIVVPPHWTLRSGRSGVLELERKEA